MAQGETKCEVTQNTLKYKKTIQVCVLKTVYNCGMHYAIQHTQNSSDYLSSYPPDNHHSLDNVYGGGEGDIDDRCHFRQPTNVIKQKGQLKY